jgi:hypothetical protein
MHQYDLKRKIHPLNVFTYKFEHMEATLLTFRVYAIFRRKRFSLFRYFNIGNVFVCYDIAL